MIVDAEFDDLLRRYSEPYHKARLLTAAAPHSGDWLHTLSVHVVFTLKTTPFVWLSVSVQIARSVRLIHACVVPQWTLLVNMRCHTRKRRAEYNVMLGSTT